MSDYILLVGESEISGLRPTPDLRKQTFCKFLVNISDSISSLLPENVFKSNFETNEFLNYNLRGIFSSFHFRLMTGDLFLFANAAASAECASDKVSTEARLVERVLAGDGDAFGELYRIFAPLVHGIVLARVPRDETADLVQEVFLSAYRNLHALKDRQAVGAWLATIARNRAMEFYRRLKTTEQLPEDLRGKNEASREAREIITTIRALPDAYRETLILRLVEGMTGQEIAEQTGLTPESVRVNLHRGMKILRSKLGIAEEKK